ncbi:hypothetical protein [Paenibacillus physcomitrellae]|uniref:Permease n=1 Tax=Paenibacillus physcomitrellae TaxID=1619311 RepID=A0ABQ1G1A4_9BACL|nr:hypothetical protein [Paenibacillus physcomitrellae]GGA33547.1 hypothetical protein GCM10010917_18420 [Paenibacillus physcomitrellae]
MKDWKANFNEGFSWKWIVIIIVLFPYEALLVRELSQMARFYGVEFNQWDFIIQSFNNHILIYYFLLPVGLMYSCYLLLREWDYLVLLRVKGYNQWMTYTLVKFTRSFLWFEILWGIIVLLVARGTPFEGTWSSYAMEDRIPGNYSIVLQETGLHPLYASLLQGLLLGLFFMAVHVSMASFYVWFPRPLGLSILAVVYFIGALVSFRIIPPWMAWLKMENLMILSSAVYVFPSWVFPFVILVGIIVCLYLIVWLSKLRFKIFAWIKETKAYWTYFLLCLVGLLSSAAGQTDSLDSIWDYFYGQFFGLSKDGFSLTLYLFYCLVFFGAVYLFQYQLNEFTNGLMYYQVLRYRSYYRWFIKLLFRNTVFLSLMLVFLALLVLLIGLAKGLALEARIPSLPAVSLNQLVYQYFVNGLLQLLNYWLIVFIVHWIWNKNSSNLATLGILVGTGMINSAQFLPVGLNSLGFLSGDHKDLFMTSLKLLLGITIELSIVAFLFSSKKIIHEGES